METMRRLILSAMALGLLSSVIGCHHMAGVCDCDGGCCGCGAGGPGMPGPAPRINPEPIKEMPKEGAKPADM